MLLLLLTSRARGMVFVVRLQAFCIRLAIEERERGRFRFGVVDAAFMNDAGQRSERIGTALDGLRELEIGILCALVTGLGNGRA